MSSTTTLRSDTARTGTNPNFPINTNPWRKYVSVDLGTTVIGGQTFNRPVRAGVLVVENWLFNAGPHLVLLCQLGRYPLWHAHEFTQQQLLGRFEPEPVADLAMYLRQ
jgi:hypothetical protein